MIKAAQPNKLLGFFTGIDTATKIDYFTIFTHLLTQKPHREASVDPSQFKWIPYPIDIVRMKKRDPNEMLDIMVRHFNKFPPTYCTIDTTREDFLADAIIRRYGESRIIPLKFGNSGSNNTKFQLKQLGFAYIDAGYEWPDFSKIEKTQPRTAKLFRILKKEMMHEQVEYTKNGRVTFDHPIGKHNDSVHAWEMSLNSVMEYQKKNLGFAKQGMNNKDYKTILDQIYKDYPESDPDAQVPIYDREPLGNSAFSMP